MIRLFVALEPPHSVKERLMGLCHGLPDIRWTPEEQMHLSLRFIGEVEQEEFEEIRDALGEIKISPFEIGLQGVGQFLNGKIPSVLWVGVRATESLFELQKKVERVIQRQGIRAEKRKYQPHITLARLKSVPLQRLRTYLEEHSEFQTDDFLIKEFILFSSKLRPQGALHLVEGRYELGI